MTWLSRLHQTYDRAVELANENNSENKPLPIFHIEQAAHIEITIDGEGSFLEAQLLEETEQTCTPCTEKSAGRSNNPPPHPMSDQLIFLAGDICRYGESDQQKFSQYLDQLKSWLDSRYNHTSVKAVYWYVSKKSLISDLIQSKVLTLNNSGKLATSKDNLEGKQFPRIFKNLGSQEKAFVRWKVQQRGNKFENTWEDVSLHDSWINFYSSLGESTTDICYVLGNNTRIYVSRSIYR